MAKAKQENEYDERRDSLVMERKTTWSADSSLAEPERERIAASLHQNPKEAKRMEYILTPTGLVRHITVMPEDLERHGGSSDQ